MTRQKGGVFVFSSSTQKVPDCVLVFIFSPFILNDTMTKKKKEKKKENHWYTALFA